MHKYDALCDEFYVNVHLNTELELPQNRETVLHFFESVQKRYPSMVNFYARDRGEFVLEEDKDSGQYRWVSTEVRRLCSGAVNPESVEDAIEQHQTVLSLVPYELSISHLDCESLNFTMGFDYSYRGNHNELLCDALGMVPAVEKLAEIAGGPPLSYEPIIQLTMNENSKTQCRLAFETRTTGYQVRSSEYGEEQLSVYLTVRRFDSLGSEEQFGEELVRIARLCEKMVDEYLVEHVLQPLQKTIALK
jgi:hypothetical protein